MAELLNKKVKHFGKFGVGTVIEQDDTSITVEFPAKTCKFQYPAAFEKFLTAEDKDVADTISAELKAAKDAEEAAKAAEAAKKAAEEQAKLEALKAQAASSGKKVSTSKAYKPVQRVPGQALTYLVFQGDTYNEERTGQFIWAPKFTKDGRTMHHWDRLMDVREGDVIFHCSDGSRYDYDVRSQNYLDTDSIVENNFRVLLTRARKEMIILIPRDSMLDETYQYFVDMGMDEL